MRAEGRLKPAAYRKRSPTTGEVDFNPEGKSSLQLKQSLSSAVEEGAALPQQGLNSSSSFDSELFEEEEETEDDDELERESMVNELLLSAKASPSREASRSSRSPSHVDDTDTPENSSIGKVRQIVRTTFDP